MRILIKSSIILFFVVEAFGQSPDQEEKILEEEQKIIEAEKSVISNSKASTINYLSMRDMTIDLACRMLSYSTGHNVIPTAEASSNTASFLFRGGSIEESLNAMCVSSGLVYRKDPTHEGYQVLTVDEFRQNNIYTADEKIQIFSVEPANVELIAEVLQSIYPNDVIYEQPQGILDLSRTSGSGGNQGGSSQSSNSRSFSDRSSSMSNSRMNNNFGMNSGTGGDQERPKQTQVTQLEALQATTDDEGAKEPGGRSIYVTVNLENHQIIVRTSNIAALTNIEKLIKELDQPIRQVVLEMKILELDVGDGKTLSVDLGINSENGPDDISSINMGTFATEAAANFVFDYIKSDFNTRVQAIATNSNVEILATPMVIAANNREAEIVVAEERVLVTGASTDSSIAGETGTRNDLITLNTELRNIGTTLRVIPRINNNNTVSLHVEQESSTLIVGNNSIPVNGRNIPIDSVDTAQISSDVVVTSGKTVALGGLIRTEKSNQINKIPVLGNIPIIKNAFRRSVSSAKKGELILLITPYIIDAKTNGLTFDDNIKSRSKHTYFKGGEEMMEKNIESLKLHENQMNRKTVPSIHNNIQRLFRKKSDQ